MNNKELLLELIRTEQRKSEESWNKVEVYEQMLQAVLQGKEVDFDKDYLEYSQKAKEVSKKVNSSNNKIPLMNLIKKLESGEIRTQIDITDNFVEIKLVDMKSGKKIDLVYTTNSSYPREITNFSYNQNWNKEFKENFYKEKGLDNCWYKDCPNKIYQTENDYKKVKIPCQDAHTRMLCLGCYEKNHGN